MSKNTKIMVGFPKLALTIYKTNRFINQITLSSLYPDLFNPLEIQVIPVRANSITLPISVSSRDKQVKTRIIQYVYSVKQVNTVNILFNSQPWHSSQRHGGITIGREEVRYEIAYRYTLGSRVHYKMTSYIIP